MTYYDEYDYDDTPRTLAQAMADGEFSIRWHQRGEEEERREREAAAKAAKLAKAVKKNPWLTELDQSPRRRRSFN